MYPFIRMYWQKRRYRNAPPLPLFGEHRSTHYCLPWDLDPWMELNNGRTLTLYDLGRIPLSRRNGLHAAIRGNGWGLAVAGAAVRYRRRVLVWDRIDMRSRLLGWDARFLYFEQSMWKSDGECANHVLLRKAVTGADGIVPPARLAGAMGLDPLSPPLPDWVQPWIEAAALRPWPPMQA